MRTFDLITPELMNAIFMNTCIRTDVTNISNWKFSFDNKYHKTKKVTLSGNLFLFLKMCNPIFADIGIAFPIPVMNNSGGELTIEMIFDISNHKDEKLYGSELIVEFKGEKRSYKFEYWSREEFCDGVAEYIIHEVASLLVAARFSDQILKGIYQSKNKKS